MLTYAMDGYGYDGGEAFNLNGALNLNFPKFFVALYLGHIKSKPDQTKTYCDQLVALYLLSLNSKCFGQV
jgi:hypothetical protein